MLRVIKLICRLLTSAPKLLKKNKITAHIRANKSTFSKILGDLCFVLFDKSILTIASRAMAINGITNNKFKKISVSQLVTSPPSPHDKPLVK